MPRAVQYWQYGGVDVLDVVEVDRPVPGRAGFWSRSRAAGTNPGEAAIREGRVHDVWPATSTTIDFPAAQQHGVHAAGESEASTADVLASLAGLLATGRLELPIAATYPMTQVHDAYRDLERRHTLGEIVLIP